MIEYRRNIKYFPQILANIWFQNCVIKFLEKRKEENETRNIVFFSYDLKQ